MSLDEVRKLVNSVRNDGLKIQSHYKKLELEYSDWEDRVNELDKIISKAEDEYGLTKEEILTEPTPFGDDISDMDLEDVSILDEVSEDSITGSEGSIS